MHHHSLRRKGREEADYTGPKDGFGSLTLGGYDLARHIPNNVSFNLAQDITRDLVVGLQSIMSRSDVGAVQSLLPSPIMAFIDSTTPYFYLPLNSCEAFERTFSLTWNEINQVYWVNNSLHDSLRAMNATITFTIGDSQRGGSTVDIALPYDSFDLSAVLPGTESHRMLFPLRRAGTYL